MEIIDRLKQIRKKAHAKTNYEDSYIYLMNEIDKIIMKSIKEGVTR